MAAISCAHAVIDSCHGALAALLPFLISARGWSYALAATLILAGSLTSAFIQPALGYVADRRAMALLMPIGLLVGATGVGCVAIAPSFVLAFVSATVAGIALGAFHPEGSRYAHYLSGSRRATGMSVFSVGGNAGLALGPIAIAPAVTLLGLRGAFVLVLPAALVATWLTTELPWLATFRSQAQRGERDARAGRSVPVSNWPAFRRLTVVVAARAFVFFGFLTFIPIYLVEVLEATPAEGNTGLSLFLVGGALGTLLGGRLADRIGRRPVLIGAMLLIVPPALALVTLDAAVAIPLLFVLGLVTVGTFSVTVVMGQEYLPSQIGVASGIIFGISGGLGALGAPLLGIVGDSYGIRTTLLVIGLLPLVGAAAAFTLPARHARR